MGLSRCSRYHWYFPNPDSLRTKTQCPDPLCTDSKRGWEGTIKERKGKEGQPKLKRLKPQRRTRTGRIKDYPGNKSSKWKDKNWDVTIVQLFFSDKSLFSTLGREIV